MHKLISGFALALALMGLPFAPAAAAAGISATDARALQLVVRAQLDAFASDDAERAFSFATRSIQTMFGTPEQFLHMVRTTYPVVYRPVSSAFLTVQGSGNQAIQRVQMQDAQGDAYLATYTLERQKNKTWRITGCQVMANKGQTA